MTHEDFIKAEKSMLIAPAGHGKTHFITDCLGHTSGRQLILTHTHAGIASINQKIKKAGILFNKCHVETITGYAQKYVYAYYSGKDMPARENSAEYYPFLGIQIKKIIVLPFIRKTIAATYSGLFVDEYQDCTQDQHELITLLATILPTRILGDPLQAIFSFKGSIPMVDLSSHEHMGTFRDTVHHLVEPWRWKGINEPLGNDLAKIRIELEQNRTITLTDFPAIEYIAINDEKELYNPSKDYYRKLNKLLEQPSLLIIHPDSTSINTRKKIVSGFKRPITLVEAIDDKDFYAIATAFDKMPEVSFAQTLYETCLKIFNKTVVNEWITDKGVKRKTNPEKKIIGDQLASLYNSAIAVSSGTHYKNILNFIRTLPDIRCYRKELFFSLCAALENSETNKSTVYAAMIEKRNLTRKTGRKISGRCIGTTLLTKGLEFETVIILNAHKFECPKNLYVALTRASKKLVVFSNSKILSPTY